MLKESDKIQKKYVKIVFHWINKILHLETNIRTNLFIDLTSTILSQEDNFTTGTCMNRPTRSMVVKNNQ